MGKMLSEHIIGPACQIAFGHGSKKGKHCKSHWLIDLVKTRFQINAYLLYQPSKIDRVWTPIGNTSNSNLLVPYLNLKRGVLPTALPIVL